MAVPFKATGIPVEQVRWPDIAPDENTRTARLINTGLPSGHAHRVQNLWLTRVAQGWRLNGGTGQARMNRIFYPRNLQQVPITIEGIMPNQFEYDRLVVFIKKHHHTALGNTGAGDVANPVKFSLPEGLIGGGGDQGTLPGYHGTQSPYGDSADGYEVHHSPGGLVKRYYRPMHYDGFILGIKAGHERFTYAPTFTMQMLIAYDHLDERVEISKEIATYLGQVASDNTLQQNYHAGLARYGWSYGGQSGLFSGVVGTSEGGRGANLDSSALPGSLANISQWNPGS